MKGCLKFNGLGMSFALLGAVILLFVLVPVLKTVFGADATLLRETLLEPRVMQAIWLTLYAALIATAAGFIFGVPLAYLLARYDFPGKKLLESAIDLPIVIPHTAAGIALLFVFGRSYFMGEAFSKIGVSFVDSVPGIVVAMLFVSVPFLINAAKEGFRSVDVRLENVARSLGASPSRTFARVTLPLAWRNIIVGSVMMWARGISEFGAVVILTYHPMIAPVLVWERFQTHGLRAAQPIAVVLILICLIVFVSVRVWLQRGQKA